MYGMALLPGYTFKQPQSCLQNVCLNNTIVVLALLHLLPGHKATTEHGPRLPVEHGPTAGPHLQMALGHY